MWTGWHHPSPIQSIRLTIYKPDVRLSSSQISKNENRIEWPHPDTKKVVELKFSMGMQEEFVNNESGTFNVK